MRIALLSDIHGNATALEAVLTDITRMGGVDAYWALGDFVALGPHPTKVLERLTTLPGLRCIRGNTDRYVVTGDRPPPYLSDVHVNPTLLPVLIEIAGSFAWTQGVLSATGWLRWLEELPVDMRVILPDGTRFLGVHAAPDSDDGRGIPPTIHQHELQHLVAGCDADLICVGHTHWPLNMQVLGHHVVNLGSVSNPWPPDLRASYVILQADSSGYRLEHHRVEYDRESVIAELHRLRHPAQEYLVQRMQGQRTPQWS